VEWTRLIKRIFMTRILNKYYSDDEIKKIEMGGAYGTYGRQKRCVQGFDGET
jgi:hypothetical protein